ncbi:MAG: hypothetical protein V7727_16350 [Sneathiella sp.]
MKNVTVLTILTISLVACSTVEYVNEQLVVFEGQHIHALINTIGFPNREQEIAGRKAFVWKSEDIVNSVVPVFSTTQGVAVANGTSLTKRTTGTYSRSTMIYVPTVTHNSCVITVEVDHAGIILNSRTRGTHGGCAVYVNDFKLAKRK